jgi:hypothetical protein
MPDKEFVGELFSCRQTGWWADSSSNLVPPTCARRNGTQKKEVKLLNKINRAYYFTPSGSVKDYVDLF